MICYENLIYKMCFITSGLEPSYILRPRQYIKKIRVNVKVTSNCVDGVTGSENISNTFANIYQELYSRHEDKYKELDSLERNISEKITEEHILDVTRITTTDVKKALLNLKPGKSDNVFYFTSDYIQNSSDIICYILIIF